MFNSVNTLYIEDISLKKDYNTNSSIPISFVQIEGTVYFEVPQWEGFGYNFSFKCKGFSTHLSKDLFVTEAIDDAIRNLYNGNYEETDANTTGWPGDPNILNKIHSVDTNLIEEYDKYIKELFTKKYYEKEIKFA